MIGETDGSSSHEEENLSLSLHDGAAKLFIPIQLPCGRSLPNRLVKVAMYEHMSALFGGPPNDAHLQLYERWANGGWGMVCTGNVQVCREHLTLGRDMVVPEHLTAKTVEPFARLARAVHYGSIDGEPTEGEEKTIAIIQLSHPGRQSTNIIGGRWPFVPPLAPSAVPVGRTTSEEQGRVSALLSRLVHTVLFQTPRSMNLAEIEVVVSNFVRGAQLAVASGFDGVQLHAAHGYLISQFLSPKTNVREDKYGAPDNALCFLHEIVRSIRGDEKIPSNFVLGVKLNAADYVDRRPREKQPVKQRNQALDHICEIAQWGMLDFVEVSGGDYEDPAFMTETTKTRQGFFTELAHEVKHRLASSQLSKPPLILLTGGLRTLPLMASVLKHDHADLLGIGRLSVLCPDLPHTLEVAIAGEPRADCFPVVPLPEPDLALLPGTLPLDLRHVRSLIIHLSVSLVTRCWALLPIRLPRLVGAGTVMAWYIVMMRRVAAEEEVDYHIGGIEAVLRMWLWLAPGSGSRTSRRFTGILDSGWAMGMVGVLLGFVLGIIFNVM